MKICNNATRVKYLFKIQTSIPPYHRCCWSHRATIYYPAKICSICSITGITIPTGETAIVFAMLKWLNMLRTGNLQLVGDAPHEIEVLLIELNH